MRTLAAVACVLVIGTACRAPAAGRAAGGRTDLSLAGLRAAYRAAVPEAVRVPLRNVVDNLAYTDVLANDLLQGKLDRAATDAQRLVVNTVAFGGLLDVATDLGIPRYDEDFGQTLGVWGFGQGPYVDLPVIGPLTLRDSLRYPFAYGTSPLTLLQWTTDFPLLLALGGRSAVTVVRELEKQDALDVDPGAPDPAAEQQRAYLAYRQRLVRDEVGPRYPPWTTPPPSHLRHLPPPQVIRRICR